MEMSNLQVFTLAAFLRGQLRKLLDIPCGRFADRLDRTPQRIVPSGLILQDPQTLVHTPEL